MKLIKQQIKIDGRNWQHIINLPCFHELLHYNGTWALYIVPRPAETLDLGKNRPLKAEIGNWLTEFSDGTWAVET